MMNQVVHAPSVAAHVSAAPHPAPPDHFIPGKSPSVGTTYEMCLALEHDEPRLVRQFHRLVETIVSQFPPERGGTILFAGAGSSSHVADVAGYVARHLTQHCSSGVILVDADETDRVLSQRFAAATEKGLVEALQDDIPAARFVVATTIARLSFLAFGEHLTARRAIAPVAVHDVVTEWRANYRYAVVAAGATLCPLAGLLARQCDATYLVVQLGAADRQQAVITAQKLTAAGARLLGSIATGVRP